mgnify:CR=1 FL=1
MSGEWGGMAELHGDKAIPQTGKASIALWREPIEFPKVAGNQGKLTGATD